MGEDERCQQFWLGEAFSLHPFGCTHWFCPVANFSLCWKTYITFSDCLGRSAHRWRFAQISIFVFENDWLLQKRRRCCILTTVMCSFSFAKPIRLSARQLDWKLSRAIRQTLNEPISWERTSQSSYQPASLKSMIDWLIRRSLKHDLVQHYMFVWSMQLKALMAAARWIWVLLVMHGCCFLPVRPINTPNGARYGPADATVLERITESI